MSFPICIMGVYVSCTKREFEASKHMNVRLLSIRLIFEIASCLPPVYFHRALGLAVTGVVLDIGTDLLIIAIPLYLLWSVKIRALQKFVVGVFFSLNLFMAITALICVSGFRFRGVFDVVWFFVWHQIEACIAVTMISLTAFRSAYAASESQRARRERAKKPWVLNSFAAIRRGKTQQESDEEAIQGLPSNPSATLTDIRTSIQGGCHDQMSHDTTEEHHEWPLCHGR